MDRWKHGDFRYSIPFDATTQIADVFEGGVTLKVDGQNAPCKIAGRSITSHAGTPDETTTALDFVRVSKRSRGIVAWVEKPGIIRAGEKVDIRIPEQWIYRV